MSINAGDIAFAGVNATNPDQFDILALNAIAAGDSFLPNRRRHRRDKWCFIGMLSRDAQPRRDTFPESYR
jgi:hypothetical protein